MLHHTNTSKRINSNIKLDLSDIAFLAWSRGETWRENLAGRTPFLCLIIIHKQLVEHRRANKKTESLLKIFSLSLLRFCPHFLTSSVILIKLIKEAGSSSSANIFPIISFHMWFGWLRENTEIHLLGNFIGAYRLMENVCAPD